MIPGNIQRTALADPVRFLVRDDHLEKCHSPNGAVAQGHESPGDGILIFMTFVLLRYQVLKAPRSKRNMKLDIKEEVYKIKYKLNRAKKCLKRHKDISKRNQELILEFVAYGEAKGLSAHRLMIYIKHLRIFGKYLNVDFDKAERKDIEKAFAELNLKNYSAWTIETFRNIVKAYWRWLYKLDKTDKLPDCVRWIESKRPPSKLNVEDLLTADEIRKLLLATNNVQYKALVSVLAETGARIGEVLQLTNRDIYVNDTHIKLRVGGKTSNRSGKRDIFLIKSYGLMVAWLNNHPLKTDQVYPVWIGVNGKPINQRSMSNILSLLGKKAGIKKRIYPYIFRHTLATHLYKSKPAPVVRKLLGHSIRMEEVYAHLSSDDVLEMLLGKKIKEEKSARKCGRCDFENNFVADYCVKCGLAMNDKVIHDAEDKQKSEKVEYALAILQAFNKLQGKENLTHEESIKVVEGEIMKV